MTAAVTYCLHDARAGGAAVPDVVFDRSAWVLESARDPDSGLFGYLLDNPAVTRDRLGAANRQPLCVWVLTLCGRADRDELAPAVERFLEAYEDSAALARQSNFHIPSLSHTAGYYFFHNFYPACRAARASGREELRLALLEKLVALPEIDGSFIDSGFSYGKSYGTAMALLSLRLIAEPWDADRG